MDLKLQIIFSVRLTNKLKAKKNSSGPKTSKKKQYINSQINRAFLKTHKHNLST